MYYNYAQNMAYYSNKYCWTVRKLLVIMLVALHCHSVRSETFTASVNMHQVLQHEPQLLPLLDNFVTAEQTRINVIRNMMSEMKSRPVWKNNEAIDQYIENPLNVLKVIKQWSTVMVHMNNNHNIQALNYELGLRSVMLPSPEDLTGAMDAIIRLQNVYKLPTSQLIKGFVKDVPGAPLDGQDCHMMGQSAIRSGDYANALEWLNSALKSHNSPSRSLVDLYMDIANVHYMVGDYTQAAEEAAKAQSLDPHNSTVNAQLWSFRAQVDRMAELNHQPRKAEAWSRDTYLAPSVKLYESLCRGDPGLRTPQELSNLYCWNRKSLVRYAIYKEEVINLEPRIAMIYDVISDEDATIIKELATPALTRATVGDPAKAERTRQRVSKVAWLWDNDANSTVYKLGKRIELITGLSTIYRPMHSDAEPFQVVNYGIGGQYEPHTDYYEDTAILKNVPAYIQDTGDRVATFLFYLTDIKAGGGTVFPNVRVGVPAVKNAAAFWYSIMKSGKRDKRSEHAGCPVLLGQKWVTNKWIRENGQMFRRGCGEHEDEPDRDDI